MSNVIKPFLSVYCVPGFGNKRETPSLNDPILIIPCVIMATLCFGVFGIPFNSVVP